LLEISLTELASKLLSIKISLKDLFHERFENICFRHKTIFTFSAEQKNYKFLTMRLPLTGKGKTVKYQSMEYDMPLFRPPSEADSLILQATYGCSANSCTFCLMYKTKRFRTRRIFLADGDALVIRASQLLAILELLYQSFPRLERVTSYANPLNLLVKSQAELFAIRRAGLTMLYYGVESGDDEILRRVKKKAETPGMIEGCVKAHAAGFDLSVTVLLGLAGKKLSRRHAENTASVLNEIQPRYIGALTLMLGPLEKYFAQSMGEGFQFLDMMETLQELRWLVEGLELKNSVFRSNHASNYLALRGDLPRDKKKLLAVIDSALADADSPLIRPDYFRAL
jgi:radical SAM superfamily enzyme YgiQ (UPF0313 family)